MYNILNNDDYTEMEGRRYLNPQVALNESNQFIDNLRSSQQADNQRIQRDTYNLGTEISSNLGGLTSPVKNGNGGAGLSYFTSRYQVPQTASAVANLRATAQAQALNQALSNEQEMWKKRYNDAYRKYQKSAYDKANTPAADNSTDGGVDYEDNTVDFVIDGFVPGIEGGYTVANILPDWDNPENSTYSGYTAVPYGGEYKTNYTYDIVPDYRKVSGNLSLNPTIKNGIFSGDVEYTLPSGKKVQINSHNQELMKDQYDNYYSWDKNSNTYSYLGD